MRKNIVKSKWCSDGDVHKEQQLGFESRGGGRGGGSGRGLGRKCPSRRGDRSRSRGGSGAQSLVEDETRSDLLKSILA